MKRMHPCMTHVLALMICFGFTAPTKSAEANLAGGDEASKSLALAEAWATALGSNQADALRPLLDATYEHIHGTGLVENKEQFLEALRTGTRKYQPIHMEDVRVKAYGRVALVTGRFALSVEARGKTIEGVNRFCLTLIEAPEGWKVVQFQATALPPKK